MLKAIHAQEDKESARQKTEQAVAKLKTLRLEKAARVVEAGVEETFSFYDFPPNHRRHIRTNNPLERLNHEIRRRTREVGNPRWSFCTDAGSSPLALPCRQKVGNRTLSQHENIRKTWIK